MRKSLPSTRTSFSFEIFEPREMLAADFLNVFIPVASIDGTGNNLGHHDWGSTDEELIRLTSSEYSDGYDSAAGQERVSAREISNAVNAQSESIENSRQLTDLLWVFGQFLDHDISITESADPSEPMNIQVPTGDIYFDPFGTGTQVIHFNRSIYEGGNSIDDIREQLNEITAFIDGSVIYGSSTERKDALREFSGGRLKTSEGDLLPFNTEGLENAGGTSDSLFLAGDVRANENIALIAMHTIWVREHNRIAGELESSNPDLTDEEIFQVSRAVVRAQLQSITYNEFLPALLGDDAIERYSGYDSSVNPNIANEFSTAAYRFGHSMLSSELLRLNPDGSVADEGNIALQNAFFNPSEITDNGIDSILQGVAANIGQEIDTQVVDDIRNFLFGPPGSGGFDLASLNIQRGRDHGLPGYNQIRAELGLEPATEFTDITNDVELLRKLQLVYESVDDVDLWIGGLSETHLPGSSLGETFSTIIVDQFTRLRDGDRFWYQNVFEGSLIQQIESTSLADVIERNSDVSNLQSNVFFDASAQPERLNDPLVVDVPQLNEPVRVVVRDGRVDIRTDKLIKRTLLLGDQQLIIRGTGKGDDITVDLRNESVTQLNRIVINAGGGHDKVRIAGVHPDFDGDLRINGQRGNDVLRASNVDSVMNIFGGAGRDMIFGGSNSDRLFGGGGHDRIMAGDGDDMVCGGRGNDILDGGDGIDQMNEFLQSDTRIDDLEMVTELRERDRMNKIEGALLSYSDDEIEIDHRKYRGDLEIRKLG